MIARAPDSRRRSQRPFGRAARIIALLPAILLFSGHIGDRNTHFRGSAGPYLIQVVVRHPGVVPGLAGITIRVEDDGVRLVSVRPVRWDVGLEGSPRPDPAKPVEDSPGLYAAELWFMTTGSYSVHVTVDGEAGSGTAIVPVASFATEQRAMPAGLGMLLAALATLLIAGLLTIVKAAVRESVVPPGESPPARRVRRSRRAVAIAAVAIALVLWGGRAWWNAESNAYASILFDPARLAIETRADSAGALGLTLEVQDPERFVRRWSPIVPDHGKLMHAFMVRLPAMDAFAHVHPARVASGTFTLATPPLPPGSYIVYADVVHETGMAQTLIGEVELASPSATPSSETASSRVASVDPDDSWWTETSEARDADTVRFEDGTSLRWHRPADAIRADADLELRFEANGPAGEPATLEAYMGMHAHAAVRRDDGGVFVHLHPTGTFSAAAQARLGAGDAAPSQAMHASDPTGVVILPYSFPRAGRYRLWVQVRLEGRVRTAAFDLEVV